MRARSAKVGSQPGSLHFVGNHKVDASSISIIDFTADKFSEFSVEKLDDLIPLRSTESVTWIDVTGIHDAELIHAIGERFGINALTLEDVMNATQRARIEEFEDYVYVVVRMLELDTAHSISVEQVSIVIGSNWIISFQERPGDVFEPLRERLRTGLGRVRRRKSDYLAYAMVDAIVDQYFVMLEEIGSRIELLEDEVLTNPKENFEHRLYDLKRQLVALRRSVWPARELTANFLRSESPLIHETTVPFLRDVYDHVVQIIDIVESFRDMVSNIGESYRTVMGNRMNEIMKVLTVIATIFIPLTFVAGIYGMNFEYMPELSFRWGYFVAVGAMTLIGIALAAFFKARKWY